MNSKQAKVSIVGAGPGDAELITVKGLKVIQSADVILYDALANKELLDYAPRHALKVFVGKRASRHYKTQDQINLLMVQYALSYGHVVRLKGGDPFVFGRAQEEIEFLNTFDIPTEVVPGISSSVGLATLQGVPLTTRHVSEGFWVITGTTQSGQLSKDIELAAQSTATVVILMGIRKLRQIAALFQEHGRHQTPVMIIQNGSKPTEKVVLGTVNTIVDIAETEKIGTPGIIVLGDTVQFHKNWPQLSEQLAPTAQNINRA